MLKGVIYDGDVRGFIYGDLRFLWDIQFNGLLIFGFIRYLKLFIGSQGITKEHLKYLILGDLYIYVFAGTTNVLLPLFSVFKYIWLGPVLSLFWIFLISYTIVKYNLLDIRVAITRATIFVLVYAFVLGLPVWLAFKILGKGPWLGPMVLMGFFATLGPFIYFYFQKRAEDKLLQEQRSYQSALRQASSGMGRIKDLNKLLHMIVYVLTRTVRLDHAVIYLYDDVKRFYKVGAFKNRVSKGIHYKEVLESSSIITCLNGNSVPIVFEEVKQKLQDSEDEELRNIKAFMLSIELSLVVPIYIDHKLIAFVGLGKKEKGGQYSEDDLAVFSILANQAALAIENAQFYEDMKITQEQLFQAEKMATIGIMADGLSHQINNRFHAMGFISGDALDTIKLNKNAEMSDKMKEVILELERALTRIQENVTQGGEVVQGLLKYTRKGEEGLSPVDVDAVISSSYEMAQFKIKSYQMSLIRDYDKTLLPKVKGNSTQLQEVFFNLIDNAYDAMMQRKNDLKEPEYHPKLTIHARSKGKILEMIFEDNGIGVKEEDVQKLFTPFFTTKLSSKKGTGLGLYVIRKIIEDNHKGKVEFSSQYMTGTQMKIYLPVFTD